MVYAARNVLTVWRRAAATRVWRDLFPAPAEVYTEGLRFMKEKWAAYAR